MVDNNLKNLVSAEKKTFEVMAYDDGHGSATPREHEGSGLSVDDGMLWVMDGTQVVAVYAPGVWRSVQKVVRQVSAA